MDQPEKTIVIGAGPAGIAAGLALGKEGIVLDRRENPAGLSGTMYLDGAVLDFGGHSFHTPHREVRDLVFEAVEMYEQRREARCFVRGKLIRYPFQRHFGEVGDSQLTSECADGLKNQNAQPAGNFEEYLTQKFGGGISRHFLLPYNRKLWRGDLRRMTADWASERVASSDGKPETFASAGGNRKPLQTDSTVAYPARGGFGEIMVALAQRLTDLRLQSEVAEVKPQSREVVLAGGRVLPWRHLISTMPLDRLMALIADCPQEMLEDARCLEKLSLSLVLVVIGHPVDTEIQRVYSADPEMPAHKVAVNHNSSPYLRSLPQHGVVAEVSYSGEQSLAEQPLQDQVIEGLQTMGIIRSRDEVRTSRVVHLPYGYPVPTHDRSEIVQRLKSWLEKRGIFTVGRFGEWAYINSDEAIKRGLELGRRVAE